MTRSSLVLILIAVCAVAASCVLHVPPPEPTADEVGLHMAAQATLTAHYIDAALQAGKTADEINAVLADVADSTIISEFWITDSDGRTEFSSHPDMAFDFPTDPNADSQAAPFAKLLLGQETVVIQDEQPRDLDAALFRYVGAAGVDKARIVQVGVAATE